VKAVIAVLIIIGLTSLLAGCDNQPSLTATDAIKLAKEDTYKIPSPPSIYHLNGPALGAVAYIKSWPDEPGSKKDVYASCMDCHQPITFTTMINLADAGYDVTFKSEWQSLSGAVKAHTWLFNVSADRKAEFIREEGDTLPDEPEGAPL
jgi:hypothetical protein